MHLGRQRDKYLNPLGDREVVEVIQERQRVTDEDAAILRARGLPVPEHWGYQDTETWLTPCREPRRRSPPGEAAPIPPARRDENGVWHPWTPVPKGSRAKDVRRCAWWCRRKRLPWADDVLVPGHLVPREERCRDAYHVWSPFVPRPIGDGPLPETLTNRAGRAPRWFVWWTLYEDQGGRCAVCDQPPHFIDHDHDTRLVRGLLCHTCNSLEWLHREQGNLCVHDGPECFQSYWADPPAAHRGWYWPYASGGSPQSFLVGPPA